MLSRRYGVSFGAALTPTEDAARKLIYLSIINAQRSWRKAYNWSAALVAFKIHFGDRLI
jgi:transposase-like protein